MTARLAVGAAVLAVACGGDPGEPKPERCHSECHYEPESGRWRCDLICEKRLGLYWNSYGTAGVLVERLSSAHQRLAR